MSRKEKMIRRLLSVPSDYTFSELTALLQQSGFSLSEKGRTSGSRVMFVSDVHGRIMLHKPHPNGILKTYQINSIIEYLGKEGLI